MMLKICCTLLLLAVTSYAGAEPLKIFADHAYFDHHQQKIIYTGNVRIEQGPLKILGKLLIAHEDLLGHLHDITVLGAPALYDLKRDPLVHVESEKIIHLPQAQKTWFIGHAHSQQGETLLNAPEIIYDHAKHLLQSESNRFEPSVLILKK